MDIDLANPNFDLADTRMTVFRSEKNWVIINELVGATVGAYEGVSINAFGNCIGQQGFIE